jgi:hypothetical protein
MHEHSPPVSGRPVQEVNVRMPEYVVERLAGPRVYCGGDPHVVPA